jgi:limonene-1,2-epoxide hydrolase
MPRDDTQYTLPHQTDTRNEAIVRAFLRGWDDQDLDAAMAQCAPDIVYLNQPLSPIVGQADVAKLIGSLLQPAKKVRFKLLNLFGAGNLVVAERLDQWDWDGNGFTLKLPVTGVFELTPDGKIREWREYYDNTHWTRYGGPSLEL